MRPFRAIAAVFATFLVASALLVGVIRAEEKSGGESRPVVDGEEGFLVLLDGGVLAGQITRAADWYVVAHSGGQMQIPQSRVMLVCRSLEEAYDYRRQLINDSKADTHLSLADWCLRHNLLADAERELTEARRLDPDHPRIGLLARRLVAAKEQPVATAPSATNAQMASQPQPASALAVDLPAGVVERFTRKVQPVLVNSCTTSGCHQLSGRQTFQLDRSLLRGEANRRTTMHNLEATLALVNRENPEQSALLTIGRKTHGGMAGPIFGPRQEQAFQHLVDWVSLVVPPPPSINDAAGADDKVSAAVRPENGVAMPAVSTLKPMENAKHALAADGLAFHPANEKSQQDPRQPPQIKTAAPMDEEGPATLRTPHRLQYGVRLESWHPRDSFDPEIFNRLQEARARAAPAENEATAGAQN